MQLCIEKCVNDKTRYEEKNLFYSVEHNQKIFSDRDTIILVMHNILHLIHIVWLLQLCGLLVVNSNGLDVKFSDAIINDHNVS